MAGWPYVIGSLLLLGVVVYFYMSVSIRGMANTSTPRLRALPLSFGIWLAYTAVVFWQFSLHWSKWGSHTPFDDVMSAIVFLMSVYVILVSLMSSRASLDKKIARAMRGPNSNPE